MKQCVTTPSAVIEYEMTDGLRFPASVTAAGVKGDQSEDWPHIYAEISLHPKWFFASL